MQCILEKRAPARRNLTFLSCRKATPWHLTAARAPGEECGGKTLVRMNSDFPGVENRGSMIQPCRESGPGVVSVRRTSFTLGWHGELSA